MVALDLPDRNLMSWVSIVILNGVEIEHSFNTEVEAENFCVQMFNQGNTSCTVSQEG